MKFAIQKQTPPGMLYFPKYSIWIFLVIFIAVSLIYSYDEILFLPAQSIHLWRQCDCLSQAMTYYRDGSSFFEPAVYNLGSDGTGRAVSDFPAIYYLTAKIWNFTGPVESVMRMINILIFILGMSALFKISERVLKDSLFALFIVILLFSSPFLVYYANNFLMDVPAFSFALVGMYFFMRFYFSKKQLHLYLFAASFAIAGLLKISALMGFLAVFGVFLFDVIGVKFNNGQKVFQKPIIQLIPFALVFIVQIVWFLWVKHYNETYNQGIFLTHIIPLWSLSGSEIKEVFLYLKEHARWDYFRPEISAFIALVFFATLLFWKYANLTLQTLSTFLVLGLLAFCLLFFQLLKDHDYYMINLLIAVPVILVSFAWMMKYRIPRFYKFIVFRIVLVAILIHSVDFARRRIDGRYNPQSWQNKDYVDYKSKFRKLPDYFKTIGLEPNSVVISLPDPSVNVSLYMMNRRGWTNYNIQNRPEIIQQKIDMGANYLIISDPQLLDFPEIRPFLKNSVGEFEGIKIFKLQD